MGDLILSPGPPVPDLESSSGGTTTTLVSAAPTGTAELDLSGPASPSDLHTGPTLPPGVLERDVIGIPGIQGPVGPQGPLGPTNLFIQQAPAPAMPVEGLWVELDNTGAVKTMWVGTNP